MSNTEMLTPELPSHFSRETMLDAVRALGLDPDLLKEVGILAESVRVVGFKIDAEGKRHLEPDSIDTNDPRWVTFEATIPVVDLAGSEAKA